MPAARRTLRTFGLAILVATLSALAISQDVAPAQNPSGAAPKPEGQKCTLSGTVVSTVGGAPVRKAKVRLLLQGQGTYEDAQTTNTDVEGRFRFGEVLAGQYLLMVSHPSFVSSGDSRAVRSSMMFTLAPSQEVKDVVVRLVPGAVLRGRVTDEDGDPVPQVQVQVLHTSKSGPPGQDPRQAEMQLHAGGGNTDDQGEFRVFSLSPGRYYVKVIPPMEGANVRPPSGKTEQQAYVPTYYPGTTSRETATAVDLRGGDETTVNIPLVRATLYPVTGTLRNAADGMVMNGMVMAMQSMNPAAQTPVREGKFELRVPAGHYSLMAMGIEEGFSPGQRPPSTHRVIDVPEGGLRNVELILGASKGSAADVSGRIRAEAGALPQGHSLYVVLQPMNSQKSDPEEEQDIFGESTQGGGFALAKADGTFEMKNVLPGTYEVVLGAQSSGLEDWYTKSIFVGPHDQLSSGITVSGSALQLDVVVSSKGGTAEGTVKDRDQHAAANAKVVLVPDVARSKRRSLYQTAPTDQNGHFSLRGVEPGAYTVYAWDNLEPGQPWFDADAMKQLKDDGVPVTIRAGEKTHADIQLVASQPDEDPQ